jgi:hypothetical protein
MTTPVEPVSAEDLTRLRELDSARVSMSMRYADLDIEAVQLLAAIKRIKEEQAALFRRLANDRGLSDADFMEIHPKTGEVVITAAEPKSVGVPEAEPTAAVA